jgi:DNA helicase-2/ATP-dependent DNA helicase PcrA
VIDYASDLNDAQYAAVTVPGGPVLVVAGAGSGKTRTIVYRIAWLAEQGVPPHSMLLLTFTRKAAAEMLRRAARLLDRGLTGLQGGTFHSFAYGVLRRFRPAWLEDRPLTVMDAADAHAAVKHCREELKLGKGDRSFPRSPNIVAILSRARNREIGIEEAIRRESSHLLPHAEALAKLGEAYALFRREHGLLDYDDLLFELEDLLRADDDAARFLRGRHAHLLVDEYQDTNPVQARLVRLLAGREANVTAVGDDAQSIYAFRGADVRNMLDFPEIFPETRIVTLEENYRSVKPVLDLANALLERAPEAFHKRLFTRREGGGSARLIVSRSDQSQAELLTARISELLREFPPREIAVLFRSGFHSYPLEAALSRARVPFRKYGGLRYAEAAHVKDLLSYARLVINPFDLPSFRRVAGLHEGIGPRTARKLHAAALAGREDAAFAKHPELLEDLRLLAGLRERGLSPAAVLREAAERYRPRMEAAYPDDWPRRMQGLEEIMRMSEGYAHLDLFIADLSLESPEEDERDEERVVLSTVHSAKGLEWSAVLIIDLVEDRFPSRHARMRAEDFEEERRLMYVACTRARDVLELYAPASIRDRADGLGGPAALSPFVRDLPGSLYEEWREIPDGRLARRGGLPAETPARPAPAAAPPARSAPAGTPPPLGRCIHRIFGRGKMVRFIPPDKYQVNFPGVGIKTILADFLLPDE